MKQGKVDRKARVFDFSVQFFLAITMLAFAAMAQAQDIRQVGKGFNHTSTGFPLTGVHVNVQCETCHTGGIFKGTPTACAGCHAPGRRVVAGGKPAQHIVSNSPCEVCHTNTVTFLGARFDHLGVQPGACQTCHNSGMAAGKPARHVNTQRSCDSCHRTSAWIPAGYNHQGVTADCSNCHIQGQNSFYKGVIANGVTGTNGHTTVNPPLCASCHTNYGSFLGAMYDHAGASPLCGTCHTLKPAGHMTTTVDCGDCHKTKTTWLGASNHSGNIVGICGTCHNGTTAKGTNAVNHVPLTGNPLYNGANCDLCHTSTTTFTAEKMNHGGALTGCVACHLKGTSYAGTMDRKSLTHESSGHPDCSDSGCHRPLGSRGSTYVNW